MVGRFHGTLLLSAKCSGWVMVGWLGRACTASHITPRCIPHSTSASFLWCFISVSCAHLMFMSLRLLLVSMWLLFCSPLGRECLMEFRGDSLADKRSVLTKLLRAKYGAAAENVSKQVVYLRKLQTWFPSSQIRSSQMCSLRVRREATALRLYRHADWPVGDLRSNVTPPAISSEIVFVTRS